MNPGSSCKEGVDRRRRECVPRWRKARVLEEGGEDAHAITGEGLELRFRVKLKRMG